MSGGEVPDRNLMPLTTLDIERDGAVQTIWLNRPAVRNAINVQLRQDLLEALGQVGRDHSVRAVVLAGRGASFCSGGDLSGMQDVSPLEKHQRMEDASMVIARLIELPIPVVVAVGGAAVGAGIGIALAADLVVVDETSRFVLGFRELGLVPDMGVHDLLLAALGPWRAKEVLWRRRELSADEMVQCGIAIRADAGSCYETALSIARLIAEEPAGSVAFSKRIINAKLRHALIDSTAAEAAASALLRTSTDHRERLSRRGRPREAQSAADGQD